MAIITYAQNFEDILLNRVFKGKKEGFYIDAGAAHPAYRDWETLFKIGRAHV